MIGKLNFCVADYAAKTKKSICNIPLKDGSSVKLLTWPSKDTFNYEVFHIHHGKLLGHKGYIGNNNNELPAIIDHIQKFVKDGIDVSKEWLKSI